MIFLFGKIYFSSHFNFLSLSPFPFSFSLSLAWREGEKQIEGNREREGMKEKKSLRLMKRNGMKDTKIELDNINFFSGFTI